MSGEKSCQNKQKAREELGEKEREAVQVSGNRANNVATLAHEMMNNFLPFLTALKWKWSDLNSYNVRIVFPCVSKTTCINWMPEHPVKHSVNFVAKWYHGTWKNTRQRRQRRWWWKKKNGKFKYFNCVYPVENNVTKTFCLAFYRMFKWQTWTKLLDNEHNYHIGYHANSNRLFTSALALPMWVDWSYAFWRIFKHRAHAATKHKELSWPRKRAKRFNSLVSKGDCCQPLVFARTISHWYGRRLLMQDENSTRREKTEDLVRRRGYETFYTFKRDPNVFLCTDIIYYL